MFGLPSSFYLQVVLWGLLLHGVWEYGQVIPLYRCWERWTVWQRIWVLPAAKLGDAGATVAFAAGTAAALGPAPVQPLSLLGGVVLLTLGLGGGVLFKAVARTLDFWRYRDTMPTRRIAGHDVGLVPILQMTILPALTVGLAA